MSDVVLSILTSVVNKIFLPSGEYSKLLISKGKSDFLTVPEPSGFISHSWKEPDCADKKPILVPVGFHLGFRYLSSEPVIIPASPPATGTFQIPVMLLLVFTSYRVTL